MIMILTGPLHLSMSGYFRDVWRKNLPGETVYWNILLSLMRNLRRAVLGGWFIQVIPCNHSQMWGFHDGDSDRDPISEHVRLLQVCLEKESSRRNSFLKHRNQYQEKFLKSCAWRLIHLSGWFSSLSNERFSWSWVWPDPYFWACQDTSEMSGERIYSEKQFFQTS